MNESKLLQQLDACACVRVCACVRFFVLFCLSLFFLLLRSGRSVLLVDSSEVSDRVPQVSSLAQVSISFLICNILCANVYIFDYIFSDMHVFVCIFMSSIYLYVCIYVLTFRCVFMCVRCLCVKLLS